MTVQLAGRHGRAERSGGSFRLTPFGGVSIEPMPPSRPPTDVQVIGQPEFDQLMLLMPDLDPALVKKIMGVAVRDERTP
ncbi:hypothetical protein [Amycolatopsis australiensis]|uniref:hypothetical protein n=1 Tax=Amycolatopsis australiensis TaxID=546364 RepID=UPI001161184A|nr:hypothetical protein [Amycolatopsis australiensis]